MQTVGPWKQVETSGQRNGFRSQFSLSSLPNSGRDTVLLQDGIGDSLVPSDLLLATEISNFDLAQAPGYLFIHI